MCLKLPTLQTLSIGSASVDLRMLARQTRLSSHFFIEATSGGEVCQHAGCHCAHTPEDVLTGEVDHPMRPQIERFARRQVDRLGHLKTSLQLAALIWTIVHSELLLSIDMRMMVDGEPPASEQNRTWKACLLS